MKVKSPYNTSKWEMEFNSAFKGLITSVFNIPCYIKVGHTKISQNFTTTSTKAQFFFFRWNLFLCPKISSKSEKNMPSRPSKSCSLSLQPRMYVVMLSLVLRITPSSQFCFFFLIKGLNTWQSGSAWSRIYSQCCNTVPQKSVTACEVGRYVRCTLVGELNCGFIGSVKPPDYSHWDKWFKH